MALFNRIAILEQVEAKPALRRAGAACPMENDSLSLGQEARELLGYGALEVVQIFRRLGIEPLNAADVEAYQQKLASKAEYSWHSYELAKYGKPVPEFALSRAISIKKALPSAQFFVEELRYNPDPFLYLQVGNTRYYLDVWDEPIFEGRRTI